MICNRCGVDNDPRNLSCTNCGLRLQQGEPVNVNGNTGYNNGNNGNMNGNMNRNGYNNGNNVQACNRNTGDSPNFISHIVQSIIQLLCCASITGIISGILYILANVEYKGGNISKSNEYIKWGNISLIVGWIYAVVLVLILGATVALPFIGIVLM